MRYRIVEISTLKINSLEKGLKIGVFKALFWI